VATSGVVASLALSVALTVMVASFRDSVTRWLDTLLPAPLYVRLAGGAAEGQAMPPALVAGVAALPQVERLEPLRTLPLLLDPAHPPVTLIVRPMPPADRAASTLPMVSGPVAEPLPPDTVAVYASEAMVDLHGARSVRTCRRWRWPWAHRKPGRCATGWSASGATTPASTAAW